MAEARVPAILLEEIRRDLKPVRPLLPPIARFLIVVAIAVVTTGVFLSIGGVRADLREVPEIVFLSGIGLRVFAGIFLLLIALHEAIPAWGVPRSAAISVFVLTLALIVAMPLIFARFLGAADAPFTTTQMVCYGAELLLFVPAFLVSLWLIARGFPMRPLLAGIAAALGVALIADAALFAHCPIDAPTHVLLAHEGAVVTAALLGAATAFFLRPADGKKKRRDGDGGTG
jgi:hypothetical protein